MSNAYFTATFLWSWNAVQLHFCVQLSAVASILCHLRLIWWFNLYLCMLFISYWQWHIKDCRLFGNNNVALILSRQWIFALVCSLSFQSWQTTSKIDDDWQRVFDPLSFDAFFAVICRCLCDILRNTWKIVRHLLYRTAMLSSAGACWCNLLHPPGPPLNRWCELAV